MDKKTRLELLHTLNDLITRERIAITKLQMTRLSELQDEKTRLLQALHENDDEMTDDCRLFAAQVRQNNRRNAWILRTGLQLISKLQNNVERRLALTYAPGGRKLRIDDAPRILDRRL